MKAGRMHGWTDGRADEWVGGRGRVCTEERESEPRVLNQPGCGGGGKEGFEKCKSSIK